MLLSTDRPDDELEHGNLKSERSWPSGCKLWQLLKIVVHREQGEEETEFYQLHRSYVGVSGVAY